MCSARVGHPVASPLACVSGLRRMEAVRRASVKNRSVRDARAPSTGNILHLHPRLLVVYLLTSDSAWRRSSPWHQPWAESERVCIVPVRAQVMMTLQVPVTLSSFIRIWFKALRHRRTRKSTAPRCRCRPESTGRAQLRPLTPVSSCAGPTCS